MGLPGPRLGTLHVAPGHLGPRYIGFFFSHLSTRHLSRRHIASHHMASRHMESRLMASRHMCRDAGARCCGDNPCGETMCAANQRGENLVPGRAGVRSRPRACFGMFWNVLEFVPLGVLEFGRNRVWKVLESLISKHSKIFPK